MNEFTNMFWPTRRQGATCTRIYAAKSNARSVMEPEIVEVSSLTGKALRLGLLFDTIIGKGHKQAIVSLTDRKARLALFAKVDKKTADQVATTIIQLLKPHSDKVHTLTSDNGREFARHKDIAKALTADFYFAHPYSSWERGTNENMNGLIRQYFPKNCDFRNVTNEEIQIAMDRLNNRPRKCLGYRTPNEVFFGKSFVALGS
jgi:IS30 family transposase